jgi:hypothetical protein
MPALPRVENHGLIFAFLVDQISRAMPIAGSAAFAFIVVDFWRHVFSL